MIDKANSYVQDPTSEDAKKASDYVAKYVDVKRKGQQFADDNRNLPRDQYLAKARKELPEAFNSGTTTESYQDSEFDDEILFNEYTINEKTGQIDLNTFEKFLKQEFWYDCRDDSTNMGCCNVERNWQHSPAVHRSGFFGRWKTS